MDIWNKKLKSVPQTNKNTSQNQTLQPDSHQRDKHLGCSPCKILRTIFDMDKGRTLTNEPKNKKANDDVWGLTSERWHRIYVSRKKEEEHSPALKIACCESIQELEDYIKRAKKD